ncbi:MAG: bifunctional phosphoribosylaminoimidazolecarboxamide formyltransferase/IMP cyclohydrolase [Acidimicrobiia bacterium]
MRKVAVRRALLSVSDKRALPPFARRLAEAGVELMASSGTDKVLRDVGVPVTSISELTGVGELLDGRVKTLHPALAAGILADRDRPEHLSELAATGIEAIDLVVVDLYPFTESAVRFENDDLTELVDVGGVTLLRAAAKNHRWVGAVSATTQYEQVAGAVAAGGLSDELRATLAREAFFRTASFDAAVLAWMSSADTFPDSIVLPLTLTSTVRYGENPHQEAAAYSTRGAAEPWWSSARQVQGEPLSFNNYLDTEAGWRLVHSFEEPAAAVIKHTNPCGVATRSDPPAAFLAAWDCDPMAAYGGVVTLNRPLDEATARELTERFVAVAAAPSVTEGAKRLLGPRRGLRVLEAQLPPTPRREFRALGSGFLVQEPDHSDSADWKVVTRRPPTADETLDLEFAWAVAAHTTSNAVVIAHDLAAIGVGAGDQSRIGAAERALRQAGERTQGAAAASDGFIPFRDTVDLLAESGVTALVQPGGSIRDEEVIEAADEHSMAVIFTGRRHFRH